MDLKTDSTSWGNYENNLWNITNENSKYAIVNTSNDTLGDWTSGAYGIKDSDTIVLLSTGASDGFSKQGIYDLAGNVFEFTLEHANLISRGIVKTPCAGRGGVCAVNGSDIPAAYRGYDFMTDFNGAGAVGFRVVLY